METLLKDIRYGYRTLLRHPGFTAVAVASLALGIGANTAIFSFINTVLLQDLPVSNPSRLVLFGQGHMRGLMTGAPDGAMDLFSWQQYKNFQQQNRVFESLLAVKSAPDRIYLTMSGAHSTGSPELASAGLVSGNFFAVLGLQPATGRFFDANSDDAPNASPYIVLSDAYWERRFHRSQEVLGQALNILDRSYTIIGVAPHGFFGVRLGEAPDLWIPASMQEQMPGFPGSLRDPLLEFLTVIGRLRPGATIAQAEANINVIYRQILPSELDSSATADDRTAIQRARVLMTPGDKGVSSMRAQYDAPLRILMVVVALVLVIACANVANLQLALAATRQKEYALRVAIGASRPQIIRQMLTESIMISGLGGLLGLLLANVGAKLLVRLVSTGTARMPLDFDLDQRVLFFAAGASLLTGVLFGLFPALRASRVDLNSSLKEKNAGMAAPSRVTFGRILVAGQVALSLGLLVTAGLLLHSFRNLINIATGFERQNVLIFKIDPESSGYKPDARIISLYQRVEKTVAQLPGVTADGVSLFTFHEGSRAGSFKVPGLNLREDEQLTTINYVSPGYFSTLHIPILLGRALKETDIPAGQAVALIGEYFATRLFGSPQNALGHIIRIDNENPVQIVGVARDVKVQDLKDKPGFMLWRSVWQSPIFAHTLAVRVSGNSANLAAAVRQTIRSVEPNLPIRWTTTLADEVSDSLVRERAIAQLSTFFAALALLLSAIGLYGTISFAVSRRTNEIGIRMALGAERSGVVGMVLRDALLLAAAGIVIGLPLALLATRQMASVLYGLGVVDPVSVAGSTLALSAVAAIAGYLPARRAAGVDPMVALRYE